MGKEQELFEVKVAGLLLEPVSNSPIVVLIGEVDGKAVSVPIWIGPLEMAVIANNLNGIYLDRPMTIDKLVTFVQWTQTFRKIKFTGVVITKLENGTYYAEIRDESGMSAEELGSWADFRPSDAIALALKMNLPIFVTKQILEVSEKIELHKAAFLLAGFDADKVMLQ